jgi:hypothetical protein
MILTDNLGNSITLTENAFGQLQAEYNIDGQTSEGGPILIGGLNGANNGLTAVNGIAQLGGNLIADTEISTTSYALTIDGNVKLDSYQTLTAAQSQALVIDPSTGYLAIAPIKAAQGSINVTGGDITGTVPVLNIAAGKVTTAKIADGNVTDAKISDLAWSKITNAPAFIVGSDSIASGDLTGTYAAPTIKAKAVTAAKIADNTITDAQVDATKLVVSIILNGTEKKGKVVIDTIAAKNVPNTLTADATLTAAQSGQYFNNEGAANDITVTLPNADPGLNYAIYVRGTKKVKIQAQTSDPISVGGIVTDSNVWIQNNVADSFVKLFCTAPHVWTCEVLQGDWTFSGVQG